MGKLVLLTTVLSLAAPACWPFDSTGEAPTPGNGPVQAGPAYVDHVQFVFLESYPVQVRAIIDGSLPTPCHSVVWDLERNAYGAELAITSAVDPEAVCGQVLERFHVQIDLGPFETGDYVLAVSEKPYPFTV